MTFSRLHVIIMFLQLLLCTYLLFLQQNFFLQITCIIDLPILVTQYANGYGVQNCLMVKNHTKQNDNLS